MFVSKLGVTVRPIEALNMALFAVEKKSNSKYFTQAVNAIGGNGGSGKAPKNINLNIFSNAFKFRFNRDNAIKNLKDNKQNLIKDLKYLA